MAVPVADMSGDLNALIAQGYRVQDGLVFAPGEAYSPMGGSPASMGLPGMGNNSAPGLVVGSPEYEAWMKNTYGGPHPSDPGWKDENNDGFPDDLPPGLTGLPTGPADTLPGNPGVTQGPAPMPGLVPNAASNALNPVDTNGDGKFDENDEPGVNQTGFRDVDNNGIDDRNQTTVGGGPAGPNYADWWAQTLAANPQMGYGGNGQMGWGGAMTTGTGPVIGGGGDSGLGGYGTTGGGSGGNFSLPGGATGTGTGGFQMPDFNPPAFTDVSGIGTTTSGTGSPASGGTGGTGFQFPDFQSPSTTTGTTTGTTSPLAGYGSAPSTGTPNTGLVQNLAGSYQQQIDAANASNESRYGTGLEMLLKRYEQAGNAMLGLTNEGVADIGRQFDRARASMDQGLIDRGLANTTVRSAIDRGYTTDQAQAINRYWDDQARKNLDEQFRQTGAITDWIGGRNDVAPSTGDLANLASGVGSAGPGATTTTGTPSTTTSTATPAPVNLPPQVTTALQNGTLGSLAATQPGANPAGTTPSSGFLNQGAGITTPEQLSAAVNGGGTTRAQTAAPPPPAAATSPLAGYGSKAEAKFADQVSQLSATNLAGQLSRASNPGGSTPQFDTGVMFNSGPKYNSTGGDAAMFADAETNVRTPTETRQFGQYAVPVEKNVTQGGTLPTQQPFMGGGNANTGKTGMDAQYAPGMMSANSGGFTAASSTPKPPPPSSPSVMGFPDPQGTGMAPGNPNDVRESMRAQNPNNKQLQGLMAGADSWMKGYGQTDPGYRGGDSGMSQNTPVTPQAMPSASAPPPSLGKVPQRPEPVPFNTAATPPASPLSGYGTTPPGMPSFMAPPGPTPAPTFQQMGGPGTQYKPPSLVGGVMMPQPPARRWGV